MTHLKRGAKKAVTAVAIAFGALNAHAGDLLSAQQEQAKALNRYFTELSQKPEVNAVQSQKLANEIVAPASSKVSAVLQNQQQRFMKSTFNRTYHADGTETPGLIQLAPGERWQKLSSAEVAEAQQSATLPASQDTTLRKPASQTEEVTYQNGGGTSASADTGSSREELVLDGSDIPKEIEFPGPAKK